ncbi:hypothetical protein NUU61_003499 [Penicillium alfredii]|uniref:Uncharacterized protein n=1 Tax=Penicillium alfredii TaxID=1506179 RepID=A0A9W9FJG9_9EURO|nr:uncharacterized protein NUU61_003499 [Penicillium alfredii]KAJ5101277.1 hypothetical protein NUU61_003499 [Penicillium alfredii]
MSLKSRAEKPTSVLAVDQLWMWVIDEDVKDGFQWPSSVWSMMEFLLGIVNGPLLRKVPVMGNKQFRESVRQVDEIQTEICRNFMQSVTTRQRLSRQWDVGMEFQLLFGIKKFSDGLNILTALAKA